VSLLPPAAEPKRVMAPDGVPIATYDLGDPDGPVVLAVHGFASSAYANWVATGWVRELDRAGYRVIALDQRGHGRSGKPHEPAAYTMELLVQDVRTVLDTYLVDEAVYVGYSLGARVGWHASIGGEHAITRAVLGGIPDGDPLTRFRVDQAKAFIADGTPVEDRLTQAYLSPTPRTRRSSRRCSRRAARTRSSPPRSGSRPPRPTGSSSASRAGTISTPRPRGRSGPGRSSSSPRRSTSLQHRTSLRHPSTRSPPSCSTQRGGSCSATATVTSRRRRARCAPGSRTRMRCTG
jgi:pimeloyl-ACP methyl ester carboxylesterase